MTVLRKIKQQVKSLLDSKPATGESPAEPFVPSLSVAMFHTGRCGSTVVARMLNQHSRVCWGGELFEDMPTRYKELLLHPDPLSRILDDANRRCRVQGKDIFGFETKYLPQQHLRKGYLDMSLDEYVSRLRAARASHFIVLRRDNYLKRAISAQVGRETKQWHVKQSSDGPTRIRLDVHGYRTGEHTESLLEHFRTIDEHQARLTALLTDADVLHLSYEEDILEDPLQAYVKSCDFLGIPRENPQIDLVRTNPYSIEAMLENLDEIRDLLQGTKYEWMLTS